MQRYHLLHENSQTIQSNRALTDVGINTHKRMAAQELEDAKDLARATGAHACVTQWLTNKIPKVD